METRAYVEKILRNHSLRISIDMAKHIPRGKRELYQDHYLKEAGLSRYKDMPSHDVFNSPEGTGSRRACWQTRHGVMRRGAI
jgi:hypothetical protein